MKKLWIDDLRDPPDETWEVVRTAHRALVLLEDNEYEEVSFDNDLGYGSLYGNKMLEGRNILGWLIARQEALFYVPPIMHIHTANCDASRAMELDIAAMEGRQISRNIAKKQNPNRAISREDARGAEIIQFAGKAARKVLPDKIADVLDKTFGHDSWDDKPRN